MVCIILQIGTINGEPFAYPVNKWLAVVKRISDHLFL